MSNYTKTTNFATKDALASNNPAKIVKGTEIDTEFNNIAVASGTKADKASPTFTGTVTLPVTNADSLSIGGDGVTVTGIKDEDDMASNSATKLASQQSIKAYVDSQVTAQDLDVTDGTNTIAIDLDSEALSLLGGTGVTSTASGNGVTMAIDGTVATLSGSQTLTNKTLATPAVTGALTTNSTIDGRDVAVDGTKLDTVETNADVTDTTNVTAAGALMDSEVTNLAQVKAFDSTDYATAAQGTTADAALPRTGGTLTGTTTFTDSIELAYSVGKTFNLLCNNTGFQTLNIASNNLDAGVDKYIYIGKNTGSNAGNSTIIELGDDAAGSLVKTFSNFQAIGTVTATGGNSTEWNTAYTYSQVGHLPLAGGTLTGNLNLGDNDKATFGAGDDLQIYHDGSASVIEDQGTGDLVIKGTDLYLRNSSNSNRLYAGTDVRLYYSGSETLRTTSTGIDVTGTATMDGLVVDGVAKVLGTAGNTFIIADATETNGYQLKANTSASADYGFLIENLAGKDLFKIESNNDISFYEDTGTTPKFFWDASAESLGIGTSSPASVLDVSGEAPTLTLRDSRTGGSWTAGTALGKLDFYTSDSTGIGAHSIASIGVVAGGSSTASPDGELVFATGGYNAVSQERMRIDSSGNVGIGTSSPDTLMHLSANTGATLRLESTDTSIAANEVIGAIEWEGNDSTTGSAGVGGKIDLIAEDATPEYAMRFFTHDNLSGTAELAERMRIDSSGNVGIGTTSPTSTLEIAKNDQTNGATLSITNSFDGGGWDAGDTVGSIDFRTDDFSSTEKVRGQIKVFDDSASGSTYPFANAMSFSTGYFATLNERMRIDSSGHAIIPAGVTLGTAAGVYNAANTLDDYEEGTWTPVLGGGATATGMTGKYTKVGNLVTAYLILENSTISGTPDYIVSGLPFTSVERTPLSVTYYRTFNTACESLGGFLTGNGNTMQFVGMVQGGNWVTAPLTAGSTRYLFATAVYQAA